MKLDILFWFYKEVDVCENRLQLLKKYNPNSKIYWLYWWPIKDRDLFEKKLKTYLDDFYMTPEEDSFQKWIHWDFFLIDWYKNRWQDLSWDSLVMNQWDLLTFESFDFLFQGIKKNQIYLPHYDIIDRERENRWFWTSASRSKNTEDDNPQKIHMRANYLSFKKHIKKVFWYNENLPFCIFTVAVLPRIFFEKYKNISKPKLWFLEYKIPTYAKLFGIELFQKDFGERAQTEEEALSMPINAFPLEIPKEYILSQLKKSDWWRLFHPYYKIF